MIKDTVWLDEERVAVAIIDQTLLPNEEKILYLTEKEDMREAIYQLKVRGAPAIGVFAALGMYVLSEKRKDGSEKEFLNWFEETSEYINASRPTAVNLSWALERMKKALKKAVSEAGEGGTDFNPGHRHILDAIKREAVSIYEEDIEVCRRIGEHGLSLIKEGCGILTHCNAGRLATVRYGTATAPMYLAAERGINFRVYCDETRPLLQGARLTAYELTDAGIDTTLICDGMSASLMQQGMIDAVFVGCDRVAANGDTANKIGTAAAAAVAKRYGIPFYVCAPVSTIDPKTKTGAEIVIEQRQPSEVTEMWYEKPMAPKGVKVYNPAFDVTDHADITAFITENGLVYPPYAFYEQKKA